MVFSNVKCAIILYTKCSLYSFSVMLKTLTFDTDFMFVNVNSRLYNSALSVKIIRSSVVKKKDPSRPGIS